jgi:outer membrane protein TolC
MKYRSVVGLAATLALAGCDMAPIYHAPVVSLPSQFTDAGRESGVTLAPRGDWWRNFGDSRLNALEIDVDAANPDLAAAYAAYQASQARAQHAVAGLFPDVDFGGGLSAGKQSANRPLRSKSQPTYCGANQAFAGCRGL